MFKAIIKAFSKIEAKDLANTTLTEYRSQMIKHMEAAAYSAKMAEFYREGITRLEPYTAQ